MKKLFKNTEVVATGKLPSEFIELAALQQKVIEAKEPKDLVQATIIMSQAKTALKQAEKDFKDKVKQAQAQTKEVSKNITDLETAIKNTAIELVEVKEVKKQNKTTGEVTITEKHNLTKGIFTFTPQKIKTEIDWEKTQQMVFESNKTEIEEIKKVGKLIGLIINFTVDKERFVLGVAPTKQVTVPARIGIQHAHITTNGDKLLGETNE